jgi:hypothetical protein
MNTVKRFEALAIDTIAAITPWLAPLIPAYLVYHNMLERLAYTELFALIGATAVEFLGLSAVHTAVTFWQWNDNHKSERAPFWFALGAGLFYVVIVLTVNAALDIWRDVEGVKILAHALLSLLSVDAAVIIAIRAQHARMLNDKRERRLQGKGTTGKTTHGDGATVTRHDATVTRAEFVTAWRANGHASIAELAQELGVNVRTAQRWVKAIDVTEERG